MSKLRIGIIGAGKIAQKHLQVIKYIRDFTMVGITSRTLRKANSLAKEFKIKKVYSDVDELMRFANLDGVLVLVNVDSIFKITKKVIPYKKPIFLEKPPGMGLSETMILYRLSKKYRTKNMVGLNRRFYSLFHTGIDIIKKHGKLLGILIEGHERFWKIRVKNRKLFKRWIYVNNIHVLDLFRLFAGDIKKVYSIKNTLPNNNNQYSSTIKFKNGVVGTYVSHWFSPDGWSVTLYGNKVTVRFKPLEEGYWIDSKFIKHKLNLSKEDKFFKPGFYNQMICFKNLIKKKKLKWPGQSLKNTIRTMKLIKQINKK